MAEVRHIELKVWERRRVIAASLHRANADHLLAPTPGRTGV